MSRMNGNIGGDVDSDLARPRHLTPDEQAIVDRRRKDARGNLAAIFFDRWAVNTIAEARSPQPASLKAKACAHTEQMTMLLDMLGILNKPNEPGSS